MRLAIAAIGAAALAFPATSAAGLVTRTDGRGRPIQFDVRAASVNVGWYTTILRGTTHGDEISEVTFEIVPPRLIRRYCGRGAGSCFEGGRRGSTITVPDGRGRGIAALLVHEYAHHLDSVYDLTRVGDDGWGRWAPEHPATRWWAARRIEGLLARGRVSPDYDLGWDRSIPEIFAEDFVRLHVAAGWQIRWLQPPSRAVRTALGADLRAALGS